MNGKISSIEEGESETQNQIDSKVVLIYRNIKSPTVTGIIDGNVLLEPAEYSKATIGSDTQGEVIIEGDVICKGDLLLKKCDRQWCNILYRKNFQQLIVAIREVRKVALDDTTLIIMNSICQLFPKD